MTEENKMGEKKLSHREFFEGEWFKDATKQLCADGWPTFIVPLNIKINQLLEDFDALQEKYDKLEKQAMCCPACGEEVSLDQKIKLSHDMQSKDQEIKLIKIRLARTVDAAFHALLEMTAWMGIPESKRQHQINEHMSNIKFCAENNIPDDLSLDQNATKSNTDKNDSGVDQEVKDV